jgi:hypothetical protein
MRKFQRGVMPGNTSNEPAISGNAQQPHGYFRLGPPGYLTACDRRRTSALTLGFAAFGFAPCPTCPEISRVVMVSVLWL